MRIIAAIAFMCIILGVYSYIVFGGKPVDTVANECQFSDKHKQLACVCRNHKAFVFSDGMVELCATVNWVGPEAALQILEQHADQ